MTNKRGNLNNDAGRGSPVKKTRKNLANVAQTPLLADASSSVSEEATEVAQGLRKTNHGVIFQLKLLMLFLIRGIRAGHAFRLGTEMEDIGGKFDDIIFQVDNNGKRQVNRYLQAKHKQNELTKITAGQLFNETEGDFSLLKYFSSYCGILSRGDDIQDCIICTNIGFNSDNLLSKGIALITVNTADEIFQFTEHQVARYKIKMESNHPFRGKLREVNLEDPVTKLKRNATDEEINSFFDKLVFVVNTPNEVHLGNSLTEEVGEYYKLNDADFQSDFILRNMLDWFKKKQSDFMTSEQGQQILKQGEQKFKSLRMTSVSINYQTKLQETIEFNAVAIDEMKEKLKTLLDSSNKIERIKTAFPKRTAVKVSAALKTLKNFERDDSYLMTSAKSLKTNSTSVKNAFKSGTCHQLLVVVSEDRHAENDSYYENLIGINQMGHTNKKVIILCHDGVGTPDDLKFTDLSRNCMEKGNERSFIGIPLQCHIVADCFESQVNDIIQNRCNLESLLQDVDSNLNLDTLYERLFMKKREIYRQEKAKVQKVDNHILHNSLEDQMECLEIYLRDLAVKTLVSDQTHIDCLLGKSKESEATIGRQHKKREEGSVCFGLLTLNRKGEYQFLHRTYPEYLMANYLYGGFRLDDNLRNKLLVEKPIRELIISSFLASVEYEGVQLFFDFMLTEILKSEKWRNITDRSENFKIPVYLKNFTYDCYEQTIQKNWNTCFRQATRKEYMNIFTFLSCCMDAILKRSEIRKMMYTMFETNTEDFPLGFFYRRSHAGFVRFVDWYDDATAEKTDILYITKKFCNYLPHHALQNTRLNQQEQKNIFYRLLDFMTKYENTLKDVMEEITRARIYSVIQVPAMVADHPLGAMADHWQGMLKLFVRDENFTSLLRPFLKLLSRTCDGQLLSDILRFAFEKDDIMLQESNLETVSNVLMDCCPSEGRTNQPLIPEVSRFILQMSPSVLQKVYIRYESKNMLDQQPELYHLTRLHLKIFRGDGKAIESLLAMVHRNLSSSDPEEKASAEQLIDHLIKRGEAPFTLIYLAAACNQEQILCDMLNCLKNALSHNAFEAALKCNGKFLDNAYDDALKYKKNEMYLTILKAVKKIIGNDYLLELVKKPWQFLTITEIKLLNLVAKIFVEDDPQGYEHLNELIFYDKNITLIMHLDRSFVRGLISAKGIDKWIKRLLDITVKTYFPYFIYDMLGNVVDVLNNKEEIDCFVKSITSTNNEQTSPFSIWAEIISRSNYGKNECPSKLTNIFDCILNKFGERAVEELIISDNHKVIAWVTFSGQTSMFNTMLTYLSSVKQEEVKKQLKNYGPQMALEILSTKLALSEFIYSNNIFKYCLENSAIEQMSQLVDAVTVVHEIEGKKVSRWSSLFSDICGNRLQCDSELQELTDHFLNKLDKNDLKKLLLHNVGNGTFIVYVALWRGEEFTWSMLDRFSFMTRDEFSDHLKANSHDTIQRIFFPDRNLISKMLDSNMNPLNFFLTYACTDQLSEFVTLITVTDRAQSRFTRVSPDLRKNREWRLACLRNKTCPNKIDDFLQRVYEKMKTNGHRRCTQHPSLIHRRRRRSSSYERIIIY